MSDSGPRLTPPVSRPPSEADTDASARDEETPSSMPGWDRLPPPAFAPGKRRRIPVRSDRAGTPMGESVPAVPDDAFLSPDEPVRRIQGTFPEDAFILPDAPLRPRKDPASIDADSEEVEVTGIGGESVAYYGGTTPGSDEVRDPTQVAQILEELARGLREHGSMALFAEPGISRFESVLRGFITGYLIRTEDRR